MEFLFFDQAGRALFVRDDAERATWTHEEMRLQLLFPFDAGKTIINGQRVGFLDALGVYQVFEVRTVRTMEPDHYQEITAEHIVISELTDEHFAGEDVTDITAQAALTKLLTGTLWSVGNVSATGTSSADLGMSSVWENIRRVEANWNVYILPRVTVSATGITGRYLDIVPAAGTWRGLRLSIDKNADEMGIIIDDTELTTALFGYGRSTGEAGGKKTALQFGDVVWTATADHPAKPKGQLYIEDPAATAAYGRNGRKRFGFYQNGDITDANVLLQKTWETLKTCNSPRVTVDCEVRDLYRLGYADVPMRLHDTTLVEIRPTGTELTLEIIGLVEDLLDPTATRPTIGQYRPNIVYINRDTARSATGGGGRRISGRRGSSQTNREMEISEFETEISANQYQISLRAYQRDMDNVEDILRQAGMSIDASGVIVYAEDNVNMIGSKFRVAADAISSEVTNRENADAELSSRITQTADKIELEVTRATEAEGALSSKITQTADAITAEVTRAKGAEGTLSTRITQNADSITAEVTNRENADSGLSTRITQNATSISSLVTKTGINDLGQNETLYSRITQNADAITSEVANRQNADSGLSTRITQNANAIALKASQSDLDSLSGEVSTLSSELSVEAGKISQIVTDVGADGKVTAASIVAAVNESGSAVTISADKINLSGQSLTSKMSSIDSTISGHTTQITQNTNAIASKASQTSVDNLSSTVSSNTTKISQNATAIASKASQTSVDTLSSTVSSNTTKITQNAEAIESKASQTSVDSLSSTVSTHTSQISQNATAISSKVSAGEIASSINQTAQAVLIKASKIDLDGYVSASELSATDAKITNLTSGVTTASAMRATTFYSSDTSISSSLTVGSDANFYFQGKQAAWKSKTVVTSITVKMPSISRSSEHRYLYSDTGLTPQGSVLGRVITSYTAGSVTGPSTSTIYYLGYT